MPNREKTKAVINAAARPLATNPVTSKTAADTARPTTVRPRIAITLAVRTRVSDVNARGGILGRKVKLIILNDTSAPNQVVTNYQKLFGSEHVDLAFGPFSSLLSGPASAVAARYGMAFVEGAGGAPSVFDTPSNQADHNVFDVSLPIADELVPFVNWIRSLPPSERPKTAAYPMAQDPFADPPVQLAETLLSSPSLRITAVYTAPPFTEEVSAYQAPAQAVAASGAQLVVLGSTDVPTVNAFMHAFEQAHYTPKIFIAASGPDQGAAFTSVVGTGNANGMLVPDGWYPGYRNAASEQMVREYVARYGGDTSGVNADVAEAYSVGLRLPVAARLLRPGPAGPHRWLRGDPCHQAGLDQLNRFWGPDPRQCRSGH
jgi:branched-chain amino acid transport system substrate-binding protein